MCSYYRQQVIVHQEVTYCWVTAHTRHRVITDEPTPRDVCHFFSRRSMPSSHSAAVHSHWLLWRTKRLLKLESNEWHLNALKLNSQEGQGVAIHTWQLQQLWSDKTRKSLFDSALNTFCNQTESSPQQYESVPLLILLCFLCALQNVFFYDFVYCHEFIWICCSGRFFKMKINFLLQG